MFMLNAAFLTLFDDAGIGLWWFIGPFVFFLGVGKVFVELEILGLSVSISII